MIMNLRVWMAEIDNGRDILSLNLAGTHDCVTQYVQLSHFARCQNKSIKEQLDIGIRGLDIRVCSRGERLKMVHGICKAFNTPNHLSAQMDMADVLRQCYGFLDENPSEAIVFQFKNDSAKEMEKCFDNLYHTYIVPDCRYWYLADSVPALGDARGRIILLRRCSKYDDRAYPLGTGIDFSAWAEQDEAVPEPLMLTTSGESPVRFTIQDRFRYKPEPRWSECILPFLDSMKCFDGGYVINYLSTAGGIKGPFFNARFINARFMRYALKTGIYYGMIYTDFPSEQLAEKIIKTNFGD